MYPIIDTHTHFYDPSRPQGVPWPAKDDSLLYRTVLPEDYKTLAAPIGITGTVVVEASPWLEDNQWILNLAAHDPFIVGLVGNIAVGRAEFSTDLARFASHPLFCGIRCGGETFARITPLILRDLALLTQHDLQLDLLIAAEQWAGMLQVAKELPQLCIVLNHLGSMPVTGNALDADWCDRYQAAADFPNIYMKVSGLLENSVVRPAPLAHDFYAPTLDALWSIFGKERLIFGSNWPVCEIAGSLNSCMTIVQSYFAAKGDDAAERFFWENAAVAYGLSIDR